VRGWERRVERYVDCDKYEISSDENNDEDDGEDEEDDDESLSLHR
jgi:hypothetical protein